ncbi:MAG: STN domain-containing protein [Pirellulales bacterium]|nr:STN domain-containing protein [Pirellulales bacterium]
MMLCAISLAEDASTPSPETPWELKIENILDQKLTESMDFVETPLSDVIHVLSENYHVPILLDHRGLDELGISGDTPVTVHVSDISLRTALRLMLHELELTYVLKDEVLLITIPEMAEEELITRVYPVGDLVKVYPWQKSNVSAKPELSVPVIGPPQPEGPSSNGPISNQVLGQFVEGIGNVGHERLLSSQGGVRSNGLDTVIELIVMVIAPNTWDEVGGPGSIGALTPDLMIVKQTRDIHAECAALLSMLRQIPPVHEQELGKVYSFDQQGTAEERRIKQVLEERVTLEFVETPLTAVIDQIEQKHNIKIQIDQMGLEELAISADALVTCKFEKMTLRTALRWILRDFELRFIIKDEILYITTPDASAEALTTISYPVGDLIGRKYADDGSIVELDFDSIIQAVMIIQPESWRYLGGWGAIVPFRQRGLLVAYQTQEVHEQIVDLIAQMRAAREKTGYKPSIVQPDPSEVVVRRYHWPECEEKDHEKISQFPPRDAIEPVIRKIVDQSAGQNPDVKDSYIVFLPDRIVVRDRRDVQARIQQFLDELGGPDISQSSDVTDGKLRGGGGMF